MRGQIKGFEDLEVWQLARRLALLAYELTASFPNEERYGLTSQIRRAAVSVPGNIAEAFGRYHYRDKAQFLLNARGSLYELKSHLMIATDLGLVAGSDLDKVKDLSQQLGIKLNNLITVTRNRNPSS